MRETDPASTVSSRPCLLSDSYNQPFRRNRSKSRFEVTHERYLITSLRDRHHSFNLSMSRHLRNADDPIMGQIRFFGCQKVSNEFSRLREKQGFACSRSP